MCTLMAGVLLVILGATGLGSAVKFIPRPVVVGFTNGIAVTIASTQLRDFFGIRVDKVPGDFLPRILLLLHHCALVLAQRDGAWRSGGGADSAVQPVRPQGARLYRGDVRGNGDRGDLAVAR